ncbi:hypothetical protein EVAR_28303_1 [Eumeta japonica]|uniref:Uncharacterized protein n=1 Tax=Eumeta variegata TaxID=151549 RepID=A0A4C1VBX1_EUMVA|nr:hypothetical protein EVAR_28303_1 [Eumeta japonica]
MVKFDPGPSILTAVLMPMLVLPWFCHPNAELSSPKIRFSDCEIDPARSGPADGLTGYLKHAPSGLILFKLKTLRSSYRRVGTHIWNYRKKRLGESPLATSPMASWVAFTATLGLANCILFLEYDLQG